MQFTITITGTAKFNSQEVSDPSDFNMDADDLQSAVGIDNSSLTFEDVEVQSATVDVEARFSVTGIEVEARDMGESMDLDELANEALGYQASEVEDLEFEVTDHPEGYDAVLEAVGYDQDLAVAVFAKLAQSGYYIR